MEQGKDNKGKSDHSLLYLMVFFIFLSTCNSCDYNKKINKRLDSIEKKVNEIKIIKE